MICSIIIRSYNEEQHIGRLIDGILKQDLAPEITIEIILVDSGSTDATVSIAQHMGAKVLSIKKEEFSFGKALNVGCVAAKGDFLIFASAHVYPIFSDWVNKLLVPFANSEIALVYGGQTGNYLTHFSEQEVFKKWFPKESNLDQKTPFCNNANCAIQKDLWLEQHYDETLTGLEDLDWANKIMLKSFKIAYQAEAIVVHVHEETASKIKNRYRREAIALKHIMPKVHVGFLNFITLFLSNTLADSFNALQKGCFFKEAKNIIIFRFMQFYGTYLGHQQKGTINKDLKNRFYYPNSLNQELGKSETTNSITSKKIEYNEFAK
jgi:glycosyltransferase involved in cell wall biosynthesis